jgi:exonuclease SbcC
VRAFTEAEDLSSLYLDKLAEVDRAQKNFDDEVEGTNLDELARSVEGAGVSKEAVPLHEVVGKITKLENEIKDIKKDLESYGRKIGEYEGKYGDKKKLLVLVAGTLSKKEAIEKDLGQLGDLPEEINDPEGLVSEYNHAKDELEELKEKKEALNWEYAELSSRAPEMSSEEIERQLVDAEAGFQRKITRGKALAMILKAAGELLDSLDRDTFSGLKMDLEKYVVKITGGRYKELSMDRREMSLPDGFMRQDGEIIPYSSLSYGTRDALGLSLRLVMGRFFLGDSKGVLVMDDPFVDMDPQRQSAGAEMLREFAEKKQLIIFTCHPAHAELIGGNRITLVDRRMPAG